METTTLGTGELIAHAIANGAKKVVVGLGGSATNDGGAGILQGLGFTFHDKQGTRVHANGDSISRISKIVAPQNWDNSIGFEVACDVTIRYTANGASRIYGPQKGLHQQWLNPLIRTYATGPTSCMRRLAEE